MKAWGAPLHWIDQVSDWSGALPATLILPEASRAERRAALHALAATALGLAPGAVEILHREGRAPVLVALGGAGLSLSSAARGTMAVVGVAAAPLGVDVEYADGGEIPWLLLHPRERAFLETLSGEARNLAFARLWSLKEAYVKAQGEGFRRAPEAFEIRIVDPDRATIHDPAASRRAALVVTRWRETPDGPAAVSAVMLEPLA